RSVVSAITQTPASGPLALVTTPPRSEPPIRIAGSAACCASSGAPPAAASSAAAVRSVTDTARRRFLSGLLHHFLIDHLHVPPDTCPELADRVFGHAALVLRRELIRKLRLDLVERRAVGRCLLHAVVEIAQVAAEERQVALGRHLAVARDDVREIEPVERV